jgi:hypothetical protein
MLRSLSTLPMLLIPWRWWWWLGSTVLERRREVGGSILRSTVRGLNWVEDVVTVWARGPAFSSLTRITNYSPDSMYTISSSVYSRALLPSWHQYARSESIKWRSKHVFCTVLTLLSFSLLIIDQGEYGYEGQPLPTTQHCRNSFMPLSWHDRREYS